MSDSTTDVLAQRKEANDPLDQYLLRKEANLKRRALRGENFPGSKKYRDEYKKERARVGAYVSENAPSKVFKREHLGLNPAQVQILEQKGLSLDDLELNKDGTANKRFLSGPSEGDFKYRIRELRKKYRREGLPEKSEDTLNHQPITMRNPLGAGNSVQQVDITKELARAKDVLECASKVMCIDLDWEALPGFYDTKYTPETKIHAVTAYIVTGSFSKAAKIAVVPEPTIRAWKRAAWFRTVANYVQQARQEELDSNLSSAIHKSMEVVQDRLEDGDYKYNPKTGEVVRIPVQAKDATLIADKLIKNRNLLRGDATSRTDNTSLAEKIMDLKNQFRTFTDKNVIEVERVPEEERE